jgi:copper chaperone CopZ
MAEKPVKIEGMNCQHCVMALRKSLQMVEGIEDAEVEVGTAKLS